MRIWNKWIEIKYKSKQEKSHEDLDIKLEIINVNRKLQPSFLNKVHSPPKSWEEPNLDAHLCQES